MTDTFPRVRNSDLIRWSEMAICTKRFFDATLGEKMISFAAGYAEDWACIERRCYVKGLSNHYRVMKTMVEWSSPDKI